MFIYIYKYVAVVKKGYFLPINYFISPLAYTAYPCPDHVAFSNGMSVLNCSVTVGEAQCH